MERKDHIIQCLLQLNDDLRAKLINLYADAKMEKEEDKSIKLNGGVENELPNRS